MRRRTVLAGFAAGVSAFGGCLALGTGTTETATPTPPACDAPGPRRVEVDATAEFPPESNLTMTASMERTRPTAEDPAVLEVTLANEGTQQAAAYPDDSGCHPFNRSHSLSDPRGILLYHADGTPDSRAGRCWTRDAVPRGRNPGWDGYGCSEGTLDAGESLTYSLEVWDDFRTDGYMPPGTYRFTADLIDTADAGTVEWWVDLAVRSPEV